MAPGQDTQLEKVIGEVLKSGDARALDVFLQRDIHEGTSLNCSQHFLTKLDKLVHKCLDQKDSKSASLVLAIISKCGDNLKLPGGGQGLCGIIDRGLIKKMVQWFEKCRQLWIQCGPQWDEPLFNLSEDFFDALTVVHEASKEGTYNITESFLYPVGQLGIDPRIYILIQKEAIRKFNLILDKIPVELKKERKILTSQEASDIMVKLAGRILQGGDYDLQTALTEALCRMATPVQRRELASRWFSMEHVANAFAKICDSEFETDCRKFLNLVNGMQGDRRRVYSYPCLEVYLDKHELLMPADEKLEEFWIDFNLGSHSISFYFSLADGDGEEGQWETICINENELQSYTVKEEGKRKVLQLKLSEVVMVGGVEGSSLTIHFSSSLDIRQAASSIYGQTKNTGFVGKTGTSVVKTTVKIIMEENSSQQVVPESQVSLGESEKSTAPYLLPAPTAPVQILTPARMRISESTTFICNSAGGSVHSAGSLSAVMQNTLSKGKGKSSLLRVRSCDRQGEFYPRELKTSSHHTTPSSTTAGGMVQQSVASKKVDNNNVDKQKKNTPLEKAVDKVQTGQREEQSLEDNYVPDTQPTTVRQISSNWGRLSVSEMLTMPTQKVKTLQRPEPQSSLSHQQERSSVALRLSVPDSGPISQKQLHTKLTQRLQKVLSERTQDCAPQEAAAPQGKMCDINGYPKSRSTADQCSSTLCAPKVQQTQRSGSGKGKTKGQMSLEADAAPNKAPVKAPNTTSLQERVTPDITAETNRTLSSKEKRDAKVAKSMVKLISSHYETNTQSTAKNKAENIHESRIPPLVNRPIFNMSWYSTAKKDTSRALSVMKSNSKRATNSSRNDIFAFSLDTPLAIGGKDKPLNNTHASSSSDIHDSVRSHNTTKKGQPVTKEKKHVKKHLFSDTDTDYAMTEVSWLRESSRKPKPKVTKYSRQAPIKPKAESPQTSCESSHLPPPSPKPVKGNTKPNNQKKHNVKERVEQPKKMVKPAAEAPNRPHAEGRRPRRAAATSTKSYREPDTDDSQSDAEKPPAHMAKYFSYCASDHLENTEKTHEAAQVMKKKSATKQPAKGSLKLESSHLSSRLDIESEQPSISKQQRPENVLQVTSKFSKKKITPVQEQKNALKESLAARQTSFCPSPPFIERMRSYERSAPTLDLTFSPLVTPRGSPLPASPDPACQDTPSPILRLPKPCSTVSSNGNFKPPSYYSVEKKRSTSRTQSIQSAASLASLRHQNAAPNPPIGPRAAKISPNQQCLSPAPQSPSPVFTQPLLTSTFFELDKPSLPSPPQSPFPEDNNSNLYGISKVSSISRVSLSQSSSKSSVLTGRVKESPRRALTVFDKTEKTPLSDSDVEPEQPLMSGPSRKRHISKSSNSEEDEKEEKMKSKMRAQRCPQMKPRKLFKSFIELSAEGEVSQVMSSSHTVSSSQWEAEEGSGDVDMDEDLEMPGIAFNQSNVCQQFSSELKKKFQNRYKMVEVYNKQSLKTVQQHVSSFNMQVTKHRTQRLEQVQKVLLEEIHKLEQDDTALRNMEKDLTIYWKKQAVAFHSYQEQETRRNESLKNAFQSNMCHSLEYEESVFTSQMCLMRKDMKSVQDRLLSEMQVGEIQSVKKGLHALFFP
ncbi:synaptonemal complex protein 2 isoform X1 [Hippoglossus hippoglossus]|uniref:synaptonemal complex protein 2 isoform X1 n=2 Tax=Hippoglossus hippoglossus TaxID=8267 RepID=UPI00148DC551|nr:synaptonemal complex protein 2 isoform X1 [Hippoglossus hippoglossus]XP_034446234.1 synaptonemal complex protein 2 isoform X1 [Hippoglossus hippoglossus]